MASLVYKRLFEVQVLHEYYLTNSEETSVFDNMAQKDAFLEEMFDAEVPSVSDAISYKVPDALKQLFENYFLRIVPGYTGFSVLTQVTGKVLSDGTTVYTPLVKMSDETAILIQLMLKKPLLANVTNSRINKPVPAIYYFTNQDAGTAKNLPALSAPIRQFDNSYLYEQGELYAGPDGKIFQYYLKDNQPASLPVVGNGYASTADELLTRLQLRYRFDAADTVMKALFELYDYSGKLVRTWQYTYSQPVKTQTVNFTNNQRVNPDQPDDRIATLPKSVSMPENMYSLQVTVNDSKKYTHPLVFFEDAQALTDCWALIGINVGSGNDDFTLYDEAGNIKSRKLPDGTIQGPPVFELRFKSRLTFWRYINDRNKKLKAENGSAFLRRSGTSNLESILPRPASALQRKFTVKDEEGKISQEKYFPNPETDDRVQMETGKIYSDIVVPVSDLFPINTS